ncbi:nucleotidyl transferase AbiEii/AbiGii toxin family protein [Cytobacillus firmus]|uniref:nucleotidyl transferase AbiEii/AbiGii toxin family protein n=1 Tax=Cytobacillus firmus TaxID=1399 RepID=UPI001C98D42D|nr:nucleotidyl transferase AbiEii/AbiGii toxin family protein [Cytobacillus firmus]MBY6054528.1 nucleotidyl transferase AbiEii/AbiGii toxin family protein [Cytobacillus firmus]
MLGEVTFTKDWIEEASRRYGNRRKRADPELIEKVTKALHLLETLTCTGLDFFFKGGTSLLLLFEKIHRFSIDIDIIIENTKENTNIGSALDEVIKNSGVFMRYEENKRYSDNDIPKAHYKIYYISVLDGTEKYILLDILFEKSHYSQIVHKDINCDFINYKEPARFVNIPSIDCILGDKLTAFAPNTTGIPYGKNKELEIIKQLFDVANLFDLMSDSDTVRETFKSMAQQELQYRGLEKDYTYLDVLDDIFYTSKIIGSRGGIERDIFLDLEKGVRSIKDYIFSMNYIIESAVNSASKAAYLSLLLKHEIEIERFHKDIDLNLYTINSPDFKNFNRIKKFDPEAYYYWYKCIEILEKGSFAKV